MTKKSHLPADGDPKKKPNLLKRAVRKISKRIHRQSSGNMTNAIPIEDNYIPPIPRLTKANKGANLPHQPKSLYDFSSRVSGSDQRGNKISGATKNMGDRQGMMTASASMSMLPEAHADAPRQSSRSPDFQDQGFEYYDSIRGSADNNSTGGSTLSVTSANAFQERAAANSVQSSKLTCANCLESWAPIWRKDKDGNALCNACGLHVEKRGTQRVKQASPNGGSEVTYFEENGVSKRIFTPMTAPSSDHGPAKNHGQAQRADDLQWEKSTARGGSVKNNYPALSPSLDNASDQPAFTRFSNRQNESHGFHDCHDDRQERTSNDLDRTHAVNAYSPYVPQEELVWQKAPVDPFAALNPFVGVKKHSLRADNAQGLSTQPGKHITGKERRYRGVSYAAANSGDTINSFLAESPGVPRVMEREERATHQQQRRDEETVINDILDQMALAHDLATEKRSEDESHDQEHFSFLRSGSNGSIAMLGRARTDNKMTPVKTTVDFNGVKHEHSVSGELLRTSSTPHHRRYCIRTETSASEFPMLGLPKPTFGPASHNTEYQGLGARHTSYGRIVSDDFKGLPVVPDRGSSQGKAAGMLSSGGRTPGKRIRSSRFYQDAYHSTSFQSDDDEAAPNIRRSRPSVSYDSRPPHSRGFQTPPSRNMGDQRQSSYNFNDAPRLPQHRAASANDYQIRPVTDGVPPGESASNTFLRSRSATTVEPEENLLLAIPPSPSLGRHARRLSGENPYIGPKPYKKLLDRAVQSWNQRGKPPTTKSLKDAVKRLDPSSAPSEAFLGDTQARNRTPGESLAQSKRPQNSEQFLGLPLGVGPFDDEEVEHFMSESDDDIYDAPSPKVKQENIEEEAPQRLFEHSDSIVIRVVNLKEEASSPVPDRGRLSLQERARLRYGFDGTGDERPRRTPGSAASGRSSGKDQSSRTDLGDGQSSQPLPETAARAESPRTPTLAKLLSSISRPSKTDMRHGDGPSSTFAGEAPAMATRSGVRSLEEQKWSPAPPLPDLPSSKNNTPTGKRGLATKLSFGNLFKEKKGSPASAVPRLSVEPPSSPSPGTNTKPATSRAGKDPRKMTPSEAVDYSTGVPMEELRPASPEGTITYRPLERPHRRATDSMIGKPVPLNLVPEIFQGTDALACTPKYIEMRKKKGGEGDFDAWVDNLALNPRADLPSPPMLQTTEKQVKTESRLSQYDNVRFVREPLTWFGEEFELALAEACATILPRPSDSELGVSAEKETIGTALPPRAYRRAVSANAAFMVAGANIRPRSASGPKLRIGESRVYDDLAAAKKAAESDIKSLQALLVAPTRPRTQVVAETAPSLLNILDGKDERLSDSSGTSYKSSIEARNSFDSGDASFTADHNEADIAQLFEMHLQPAMSKQPELVRHFSLWRPFEYRVFTPHLLHIPTDIRFRIYKFLLPGPVRDRPILLSPISTVMWYWPQRGFRDPAEVFDKIGAATMVCRQLHDELMAFYLNQMRFHITLNCTLTTSLAPKLWNWVPLYAHQIQYLTIELDFTKGSGDYKDGSALKPNGVAELQALLNMLIQPLSQRKSPMRGLTVMVRRYDGDRPSGQLVPYSSYTSPYQGNENVQGKAEGRNGSNWSDKISALSTLSGYSDDDDNGEPLPGIRKRGLRANSGQRRNHRKANSSGGKPNLTKHGENEAKSGDAEAVAGARQPSGYAAVAQFKLTGRSPLPDLGEDYSTDPIPSPQLAQYRALMHQSERSNDFQSPQTPLSARSPNYAGWPSPAVAQTEVMSPTSGFSNFYDNEPPQTQASEKQEAREQFPDFKDALPLYDSKKKSRDLEVWIAEVKAKLDGCMPGSASYTKTPAEYDDDTEKYNRARAAAERQKMAMDRAKVKGKSHRKRAWFRKRAPVFRRGRTMIGRRGRKSRRRNSDNVAKVDFLRNNRSILTKKLALKYKVSDVMERLHPGSVPPVIAAFDKSGNKYFVRAKPQHRAPRTDMVLSTPYTPIEDTMMLAPLVTRFRPGGGPGISFLRLAGFDRDYSEAILRMVVGPGAIRRRPTHSLWPVRHLNSDAEGKRAGGLNRFQAFQEIDGDHRRALRPPHKHKHKKVE